MPVQNLQSYLSARDSRRFTPEEQADIARSMDGNWFGKIFESYGTPAHENLASPSKAAILAALAGGGLGGVGGAMVSGKGQEGAGALLGAGLGSSLAGVLAYYLRDQSNNNLLELMRRSPVNPTLRDVWSDPLYQADMERARVDRRDVAPGFLPAMALMAR